MTGNMLSRICYYVMFSLFAIELYALDDQGNILDPDELAELIKALSDDQKLKLIEAGFNLIYKVKNMNLNFICL